MSRRRCPNCDASKIGRCSRCHGTGYLDMFQDPFSVPVTLIGGERTRCDRCGGDGQCKTCGGQGEIREGRPGEEAGPQLSEISTTERTSHSGSKEAGTKVRDDESFGAHSALAGLGAPIGGLAGGGGGGGGGGGCGCALIILFIIIGIPAGLFIQRQKKRAYIAELEQFE